MGIIFMMFAILLIAYSFLATRLLHFIGHLVFIRWLHFSVSANLMWSLICLALLPPALYFFYKVLEDSKGGTPDISGIWKFFMVLSVVLFGISWFVGLKSK